MALRSADAGPRVSSVSGSISLANEAGRRTFRALRHRNFRLFFYGQLISLIGTWLQAVAQQWLIYRLTGSSLLLGFVVYIHQRVLVVLAGLSIVGGVLRTAARAHDEQHGVGTG